MPLFLRLILSLACAVIISGIYINYEQHQAPGYIFDLTAAIAFALAAAIAVALSHSANSADTTKTTSPNQPGKSPSPGSHLSGTSSRETGEVKWFNGNKGFGFITCDNGKEVFVHFRSVQKDSRRLSPGKRVEFRVVEGKKGKEADNVRVV